MAWKLRYSHPEIALSPSFPAVKHQVLLEDGAVGPVTTRSGTSLPSLARGFNATRSHEYVPLQSVFPMKVSKARGGKEFLLGLEVNRGS
jgi:hypothetical protein